MKNHSSSTSWTVSSKTWSYHTCRIHSFVNFTSSCILYPPKDATSPFAPCSYGHDIIPSLIGPPMFAQHLRAEMIGQLGALSPFCVTALMAPGHTRPCSVCLPQTGICESVVVRSHILHNSVAGQVGGPISFHLQTDDDCSAASASKYMLCRRPQ